jgi:hypothetical protein
MRSMTIDADRRIALPFLLQQFFVNRSFFDLLVGMAASADKRGFNLVLKPASECSLWMLVH